MELNNYEKEIIKYLGQGLSQKQISNTYKISPTTVNNLLRRARVRNNMLSTIQMVAEARVKNIV